MNELTLALLVEKFGEQARSGLWFWVNHMTTAQRLSFVLDCHEQGYQVFISKGVPVVNDNRDAEIWENVPGGVGQSERDGL